MNTRKVIVTWNVNLPKNRSSKESLADREQRVANIVQAVNYLTAWYRPSILALQEATGEAAQEIRATLERNWFEVRGPNCKGLVTAFSTADWIVSGDVDMIKSRAVRHECRSVVGGAKVMVYNFHCPSRQRGIEKARAAILEFVIERAVFMAQQKAPLPDEILCGDFNLDPFDDVMRQRSQIGGVRCRDWVLSKNNPGTARRWYYNPCWRLMFSNVGGYGTYYYSSSDSGDAPWYVFDQVMYSAGLLEPTAEMCMVLRGEPSVWSTEEFVRTGSEGILKLNNRAYSDHLPVMVSFRLP